MRLKGEHLEEGLRESSGLWTGIPKGSSEAREGVKEQSVSGSPHCILKLNAAGVWNGRRYRARDVSERRARSQRLHLLGQRS